MEFCKSLLIKVNFYGVKIFGTWEKYFSKNRLTIGTQSVGLEALISGVVVQLVRMLACHAGGRGFESRPSRN